MSWFGKKLSDEDKKNIEKRFDELIKESSNIAQEDLKFANSWGNFNIFLIFTHLISSTLAMIFTFYYVQVITISATITCTISALCLTSLKPYQRESKRRIYYAEYSNLTRRIKNHKLSIKSPDITLIRCGTLIENYTNELKSLSERRAKDSQT